MTGGTNMLAHIERAEVYVSEAGKLWNPTDESHCLDCTEALRLAVAEMEAACSAAAAGSVVEGAEERIGRLRADVDQLARRVDAAMAFCRGLALRSASDETARSEELGVSRHV